MPRSVPAAVLRPPRRHRDVRPGNGGEWAGPGDRDPAAITIAGFYEYAVEEDLLDHSPAAHVRRPRLDYESHASALDRNELGALLVAAGLGPPAEHALISLLALNGLRVSEATGADIEHLGLERGHRTLVITRKGGKVVTIPLAPRTAWAIDLAVGERTEGPLFTAADGRRLDRHGAARIVRRVTCRAGIAKHVGPHTLRHAFITAALDAGVPLRRAGGRLARRPAHHHALRPGPDKPGPACDLHRRHLHRRGSEVAKRRRSGSQPGRHHRRSGWRSPERGRNNHQTLPLAAIGNRLTETSGRRFVHGGYLGKCTGACPLGARAASARAAILMSCRRFRVP